MPAILGQSSQKKLNSNWHYTYILIGMSDMQVIADITKRMGAGMAKYIEQDVETIADYDEYCHFVAGLVGVGLSQASHRPQLS